MCGAATGRVNSAGGRGWDRVRWRKSWASTSRHARHACREGRFTGTVLLVVEVGAVAVPGARSGIELGKSRGSIEGRTRSRWSPRFRTSVSAHARVELTWALSRVTATFFGAPAAEPPSGAALAAVLTGEGGPRSMTTGRARTQNSRRKRARKPEEQCTRGIERAAGVRRGGGGERRAATVVRRAARDAPPRQGTGAAPTRRRRRQPRRERPPRTTGAQLSRHEVVRHRVAAAPRMTQGDHVHATRARENMTREEETAAVTTSGWQHSRKSM